MIDIKQYKHIIWDWNGTLFDDIHVCCDIMNGLLSRRNLPTITVERYREAFTFPVREYYRNVGHDVSEKNWEIISYEFIDEYEIRKNECALFDNAVEVLDMIRKQGKDQSVLSAYSQNNLDAIIDHFKLSDYFIRLIGLDNIYAAGKIDNGIRWMQELGHGKGDVLLIGDTVHDFEVAEEIGADCLLVAGGHQEKKKLLQATGNVLDSISELLLLLK